MTTPGLCGTTRCSLRGQHGVTRAHFSGLKYVIVPVTRRQLAHVSEVFLNSRLSRMSSSVIARISVKLVAQLNARQAGHRGSPGACLRMALTA